MQAFFYVLAGLCLLGAVGIFFSWAGTTAVPGDFLLWAALLAAASTVCAVLGRRAGRT